MAEKSKDQQQRLDEIAASENRSARLLDRFGIKPNDSDVEKIETWFSGDAGSITVAVFVILVVIGLAWNTVAGLLSQFFGIGG